MPPRRRFAQAMLGPAVACALLLAACKAPPPGPGLDLLDGHLQPTVLVEAPRLAIPPSLAANRFLRGWLPASGRHGIPLAAGATGAWLELVQLGSNPRTLNLQLADPSTHHVLAAAGDQPPRRLEASGNLALAVAAPSTPGPILVSLRPLDHRPLRVQSATLAPSLPPGRAALEKNRLRQSASSLVRFPVSLPGPTTLIGTLTNRAPRTTATGGEAEIWWQDASGASRRIWHTRLTHRGAVSHLQVPISDRGSGRVSLLVRGTGQGVEWQGLGLVATAPKTLAPSSRPAHRPRIQRVAQPPKHVVVVVLDALRQDFVGYAGGPPGVTPNLDRMAGEGLVFLRHRSVAPNTIPSTKALFTGRIWRQRGGWKLPPDLPTLAEVWHKAGYRTGLFSTNPYVSAAYGMDRGFDFVASDLQDHDAAADGGDAVNRDAAQAKHALEKWLDHLSPDTRTFAYVHVLHPHNPYTPPAPFRDHFAPAGNPALDGTTRSLLDIEQRRIHVSSADIPRLRGLYAANLAYADAQIGDLVAHLQHVYRPGDLFVVVTADHGEELLDHGGVLHGYTLYEEQLRIPLLLWCPPRIPPSRSEVTTDTLDLRRLLVDLATGKTALARSRKTLVGLRRHGKRVELAAAASLHGGIFAARRGRWKVIWAPRTGRRWGMGQGRGRSHDAEYVFDLQKDPQERRNLAGIDLPRISRLQGELQAWIAETTADSGQPVVLEPEELRRLRALGYTQ